MAYLPGRTDAPRAVDRAEVAVVSTSVNERPEAYALWAKQGDLIVAGDMNSPGALEEYVKELGGTYLRPEDQTHWAFSDALGWSCIQRRNAAVMTAYQQGYRYVATVDDDNAPTVGWVSSHAAHVDGHIPFGVVYVHGDDGWVDIGQFNIPRIRQRGTPFGAVLNHRVGPVPWMPMLLGETRTGVQVVVSTAQVLGDPDCDAITRITEDPQVKWVTDSVVVAVEQYAAFNSQATLWRGDWSPLIACLPYVGRYDDIFASFIAKRIMREHNATFYAGHPMVTQDRNEHDALEDLCAELYGMENTRRVVRALDEVKLDQFTPLDVQYQACTDALQHVLPLGAIQFMNLWRETWSTIREQRGASR